MYDAEFFGGPKDGEFWTIPERVINIKFPVTPKLELAAFPGKEFEPCKSTFRTAVYEWVESTPEREIYQFRGYR